MSLPSGYKQLRFIQSDGNQYIDTLYKNTSSKTKVEIDCEILLKAYALYGAYNYDQRKGTYISMANNGIACAIGNLTLIGYIQFNLNTRTTITQETNNGSYSFSAFGETRTGASLTGVENTNNICLFAFRNGNNQIADKSQAKLYSCKMWDNDILVRDFIPAKRLSDNAIGLYDQANDVFYTNSGTGQFIPSLDFSDFIELEYIESSGTQYINTNIKLTSAIDFDISFAFDGNDSNDRKILGSTTNGNQSTISNSIKIKWGERDVYTQSFDLNKHIVKKETNNIIFDGTNVGTCGSSFSNQNTYIFATYLNGNVSDYVKAKLYYLKMWDNGTLVRDFIPVINKSNLSMGLWDRVNEEFYGNNGSGVFTGKFKENPQPSSKPFDIVFFYPNGTIQYDVDKAWDYNEKKLFDTWEMLSNVQIVKQDEDTNVVAIYNQDGTTLRGAYTILNDGTIQQISDGVAIPNRVGSNKTKYVFDSNNELLDLAKANLPNLQYNHKITFNINFDGEYKFDDFNLAQPIKFYSTKDNTLFNSILTGRKYEISQNSDVIQNATFTLGKVRTDLTSKLNKVR